MDTVFIPRDARLSRHENALVVTSDDSRKVIPLHGVKHVVCMGNGSISIRLLKDMGRRGIRFTVLDAGGAFLGAFEPEDDTPSGRVRIGQARLYLSDTDRLRIARAIVTARPNQCVDYCSATSATGRPALNRRWMVSKERSTQSVVQTPSRN